MKTGIGYKYVNPKICFHLWREYIEIKPTNNTGALLYERCKICHLEGPPAKIGTWRWLAQNRATRNFFELARTIDQGGSNAST